MCVSLSAGQVLAQTEPTEPEAPQGNVVQVDAAEEQLAPFLAEEVIAADARDNASAAGVTVPLTFLSWMSIIGAAN